MQGSPVRQFASSADLVLRPRASLNRPPHRQVGATVALSTLGTMVGADSDGIAVLDELYSAGLPARLLQELTQAPHRALLQARQ